MNNKTVKYYQKLIGFIRGCIYRPKGYIDDLRKYLEEYQPSQFAKQIHSSENITRTDAKSFNNILNKAFQIPAKGLTTVSPNTYIYHLKSVRVIGTDGAVVSENNKLIADISTQIGLNLPEHSLFKKRIYSKLVKVKGKTLLISANGASTNYFHWIFDLLPQIEIIIKAGCKLDEFDQILLSGNNLPFQLDSLQKLNFPIEKIVWLNNDSHFFVENLIVSSLPGLSGNIPHWVIDYLHDIFSPFQERNNNLPEKIWIDRSDAKNKRKIDNVENIDFNEFKDFEKVQLSKLTFQQQIDYFYNAKEIAGIHGAGFTNLLFCQPGVKVVEIFQFDYINQCYWTLASHKKLDYNYKLFNEYEQFNNNLSL